MAVAVPSSAPYLRDLGCNQSFTSKFRFCRIFPPKKSLTIIAMAAKKMVDKHDDNWRKQWFGAGIFYESSEEVEVDVFKKLEKRKVLSNVEKAGLLSKAEELGFTHSSLEKLGVFSEAEELGLLSLLEKSASFSPSALALAALPALVAAVGAIGLIPDDSVGLVVLQAIITAVLGVGAVGLFVGSVVLGGLQEADSLCRLQIEFSIFVFSVFFLLMSKKNEDAGIDPCTSRMLSEHSTIPQAFL